VSGGGEEGAWFAGKEGVFYVFRVNRRPLPEESLFEKKPDSPFDHFSAVLEPGFDVVTGRGYKRGWKVGGVEIDPARQVLTGKLGWYPLGKEVVVPDWSEEEQDWLTEAQRAGGGVMPFGFDGETRLLTVLLDSQTRPNSVAGALEDILQGKENKLVERSTDWAVEPVLDAREFVEWLRSLDVVQWTKFEARLPNPEPMDQFRKLGDRLKRHDATKIVETISSEKEGGLRDVEQDEEFREGIAMGEQGFATLRGKGQRDGKVSSFRQNEQVARERVEDLPPTWDDVFSLIGDLLKDKLRRFLDDDDGR
jgi:hypothetical protein